MALALGARCTTGGVATATAWTDQLIFPRGSIDYFDRVVAANGGLDRVREFDRLFMVPGMKHCAGGAGAVNFGQSGVVPVSLDPNHDAILALQRWVEEGIAPDDLIATTDPQPLHARENTTNSATFTRLLCPFPEVARFMGGDPDTATSFECVNEERKHDHDRDEGRGAHPGWCTPWLLFSPCRSEKRGQRRRPLIGGPLRSVPTFQS